MNRSPHRSKHPSNHRTLTGLLVAFFIGFAALLPNAANAAGEAASGTTVISPASRTSDDTGTTTGTQATPSSNARRQMLADGTRFATPYYDNDSGKPGPTVVVVGGMHGNETAGYTAARQLTNLIPKRGRLIVIPEANKLGIEANSRNGSHPGDLNRDFPRSKSESADSVLAKSIWSLMRSVRPDYLFDLHEGYDFHKINKSSVGQSLIYYPTGDAYSMAKTMQSKVNQGISNTRHHFSLLKYPIKGSLARATGIVFGTKAMILETSRKQPLERRVGQHVTMVKAALERLQML